MNARFLWSGAVAFCFEALIFIGLFYALLPKPKELYTAKDKTKLEFIQIDQILDQVPKKKETPKVLPKEEKPKEIEKKESKPIEEKPKEEKPIEKKAIEEKPKEEPKPLPPKPKVEKPKTPEIKEIFSAPVAGSGVKNLFAKVDSANPPIREEEAYDDRPIFSANSIQSKDYAYTQQDSKELAKETSKLKNTLKKIWEKELEMTSTPPQDISDGKYDEWFAKVKRILYTKWDNHFYESVAIVVHITITDQGQFSYRVIKKSKNSSYNTYMQNLLQSLCQEKFPPYPKGKQKSIEVIFKTKEQGNA